MLKAKDIAKKLKLKLYPKRVGMIVEGFGVPHVHVHLVPINEGLELNPLNGKPTTPEELAKIANIILG
jgi:histidine triad (HIT) family protein